MSEYLGEHVILATIEVQRAETVARLSDTAEYKRLKLAADNEAFATPDRYLARNLLVLHVEMNMPSINATLDRARADRAAARRKQSPWRRLLRRVRKSSSKQQQSGPNLSAIPNGDSNG